MVIIYSKKGSYYLKREGLDPINQINICWLSQRRTWISNIISHGLVFKFNDMR